MYDSAYVFDELADLVDIIFIFEGTRLYFSCRIFTRHHIPLRRSIL